MADFFEEIAAGLIVAFVVALFAYWRNPATKRFLRVVIIVIIVLIAGGAFLGAVLPVVPQPQPYRVDSVGWCSEDDGDLRVTGRLLRQSSGEPVPGYAVQVKIFQVGTEVPIVDGVIGITDVTGEFVVRFSEIDLDPRLSYLINTAYSYNSSSGEIWDTDNNSLQANPTPCVSP